MSEAIDSLSQGEGQACRTSVPGQTVHRLSVKGVQVCEVSVPGSPLVGLSYLYQGSKAASVCPRVVKEQVSV